LLIWDNTCPTVEQFTWILKRLKFKFASFVLYKGKHVIAIEILKLKPGKYLILRILRQLFVCNVSYDRCRLIPKNMCYVDSLATKKIYLCIEYVFRYINVCVVSKGIGAGISEPSLEAHSISNLIRSKPFWDVMALKY
jgi:hypothetical protein